MKIQRLLVLTVVLVLGLSSVASGLTRCLRPPHSDAPSRCQVITFADEGMESAVREAIEKPSGSIVYGDVASMAEVKQVRSLKMGDCIDCHRDHNAPTDCVTCHY